MLQERKHWLKCESKNCLKSIDDHFIHSDEILSEPEDLLALIFEITGLSSSRVKGATFIDGGLYFGTGRGRGGHGISFQIVVAKYSAMVSNLLVESQMPCEFLTIGGVG
jgi:hypothetical protein